MELMVSVWCCLVGAFFVVVHQCINDVPGNATNVALVWGIMLAFFLAGVFVGRIL